jgi:gliding motility-associated-like protein
MNNIEYCQSLNELLKGCLAVLILIAPIMPLECQIIISGNTTVTISENTLMSCPGYLKNYGLLKNNGSIYVSGLWDNKGVFNEAQGKVILNGENQYIYHNSQSFFHLEINGSEKFIEDTVLISGSLNLNSGIVTPKVSGLLLLNEGAEILSSSTNSFINGALFRAGTGDKFYPVGKNGNYCPVTLYQIEGNDPVTGIEVFEPNPDPLPGIGLYSVSTERYWQKTQLAGSFNGAFPGIILQDNNSLLNFENIVVAEASAVGSVFKSLGRSPVSPVGEIIGEFVFDQNILTLAEKGDINIINIITPNNDGVNDFLTISNIESYPENELIILDRLGNSLLTQKNYSNTWNGQELPAGNYYCIFKIAGSEKVYKQTFSIIK